MMAAIVLDSFYAGLEAEWAWVLWLLAAGAIGVLGVGADRLVTSAVRLAAVLGMSKVIIGATVVSLGTTTPEVFTSVTAAFQGRPGLALGNGVGSIICDTALIFGLACTTGRVPLNRYVLDRHGWLQLGSGVLLTAVVVAAALAQGGIHGAVIPRAVGFVFVGLLVGYLYVSVRWARQRPDILPEEVQAAALTHRPARPTAAAVRNLAVLAVGLVLVIVGSNVLVGSAGALCHKYGVPENVLAVTLVAFGTSLPELVTAIASILKGHAALLVGNIIGADILNVLSVIGLSAAASPLWVAPEFFWLHLPVMMLVLVMLRVFIHVSGDRFRRWQGVLLLAVYGVYCIILLAKFGVVHGPAIG